MSARQLLFAAAGADTSLDLNFLTGALDPRITFTRADTTAVASYFDALGTLRFGPVNLVTQSVSLAGWTLANTTNTGASGTAPDGGNNMVRIAETAVTNFHTVYNPSLTVINGARYTLSIYAKAAEDRYLQLGFDDGAANGVYATYDTQTGVISGAASATGTASLVGGGATITSVGAGIYRCTLTGSIPATAARIAFILCNAAAPSPFAVYAGNASNGLLVWGAQLEPGPVATQYIPTSGTASGGPRFDYDPVTLLPRGLLIEEARTNSLRNSMMTGAVAASPGTVPTNWALTAPTGVTRTITLPVVNGIQYIDINYSGTTSSTAQITFQTDTNTAIAAVSGQAWTASMYFQVTQDDVALTTLTHAVQGMTSVPALAESFTASLQAGRLTLSRATLSATLANGTTASVRQTLATNSINSGTVINLTFRLGAPQLELGAFATSYIATSTVAATRAADVATMPVASWFNAAAGTWAADLVYEDSALVLGRIIGRAGGAVPGLIIGHAGRIYSADPATQIGPNSNAVGTGLPFRPASSWGGGVGSLCLNGGPVFTAAQATGFGSLAGSSVQFFGDGTLGQQLSGYLRRVRYWPRALSGPELQQATS